MRLAVGDRRSSGDVHRAEAVRHVARVERPPFDAVARRAVEERLAERCEPGSIARVRRRGSLAVTERDGTSCEPDQEGREHERAKCRQAASLAELGSRPAVRTHRADVDLSCAS